jgi:hypothetical protein
LRAGLNGVSFDRMDNMLKPYAKPFKRPNDPYVYNRMLSTQQSEAAAAAAVDALT